MQLDFRLNFFVDEVGQYVADNVKLMTNLQTVAEVLGGGADVGFGEIGQGLLSLVGLFGGVETLREPGEFGRGGERSDK